MIRYKPTDTHFGWITFASVICFLVVCVFSLGAVGVVGDQAKKQIVSENLAISISVAAGIIGVILGIGAVSLARAIVLTTSEIRIPQFIGTRRIGIAEIAGIGLVRRIARRNYGTIDAWELSVWTSDGHKTVAQRGFSYISEEYPKGFMTSKRTEPGAALIRLPENEILRLVSSPAAQVARQVYRGVLQLQGASGELARRHLQKHVKLQKSHDSGILGYWSPDGEIGMIGYHAGDDEVVRLKTE